MTSLPFYMGKSFVLPTIVSIMHEVPLSRLCRAIKDSYTCGNVLVRLSSKSGKEHAIAMYIEYLFECALLNENASKCFGNYNSIGIYEVGHIRSLHAPMGCN